MKGVLSILVVNNSGVLNRVANLFSRRGYNIKALTVGETEDPQFSRITIETESDTLPIEQIRRQLEKLEDVKKAMQIDEDILVSRELVLVKTPCKEGDLGILIERISPYNAKVIALTEDAAVVEMTGGTDAVSAFVDYMEEEGIMEMCRTGGAALGLGKHTLYQSNPIK